MIKDLAYIAIIAVLIALLAWNWYRSRQTTRTQQEEIARLERNIGESSESEARFQSIFENSLDGILLTVPDGRILAANPSMCRMLGRSEEELCRLGREGVVDPSDPQLYEALQERTSTGRFNRILRLKKSDGTTFPAEISSAVFKTRTGEPRTSMIVRDISARVRAEETLHENEARQRMLLEKMPAFLWVTDPNLVYTYSSGSGLARFGLKPGQAVGTKLGELSGPESPAVARAVELNRRVLKGESVSYDIELVGRILHCDVEPLYDAEGKLLGTIGVGLDVTEHRLADRELLKLSMAIEQTGDAVIITNKAGMIEYVNPAFEAITGFTREEALGKDTNLVKSGHHTVEFYTRLWNTILSGGTFRAEFVNRKKNGELYYEEKTISPLRNADGEITHFISTGKDITERMMTYRNLEAMVQERTREVERLYAHAEQHRRELEALYNADEQLYRHLRLEDVLQALVNVVVELLNADKSNVQVWDEARNRLVVAAWRGFGAETIEWISNHPEGDGISHQVYASGKPELIEDMFAASGAARYIAAQEGIHAMIALPIIEHEQVLGVFSVNYCRPRSFGADEQRLLLAIAQRGGVAIANARLYEQAEQAAIVEERQRMARDLHDSVTQSLYSLTLIAEAGRRTAAAGDLELAGHYISRLGETARQALKEMRLMVFELRPAELQGVGLVKALQQRLDDVEKRTGTEVLLQVEGEVDVPEAMVAPVYHIAQEALNNALKHAKAAKITVHLRGGGDCFELEIQDDGVGFEPETAAQGGGMGLGNMRERARQLGGELQIDARPDMGTRVCLRVPVFSGMQPEI